MMAEDIALRQIIGQEFWPIPELGQQSQSPEVQSIDALICTVIVAAGTANIAGARATQSARNSVMTQIGVQFAMSKLYFKRQLRPTSRF